MSSAHQMDRWATTKHCQLVSCFKQGKIVCSSSSYVYGRSKLCLTFRSALAYTEYDNIMLLKLFTI